MTKKENAAVYHQRIFLHIMPGSIDFNFIIKLGKLVVGTMSTISIIYCRESPIHKNFIISQFISWKKWNEIEKIYIQRNLHKFGENFYSDIDD